MTTRRPELDPEFKAFYMRMVPRAMNCAVRHVPFLMAMEVTRCSGMCAARLPGNGSAAMHGPATCAN